MRRCAVAPCSSLCVGGWVGVSRCFAGAFSDCLVPCWLGFLVGVRCVLVVFGGGDVVAQRVCGSSASVMLLSGMGLSTGGSCLVAARFVRPLPSRFVSCFPALCRD